MKRLSSHLSQRRFFLNCDPADPFAASEEPELLSRLSCAFSFLNSSSITNTLVRYFRSDSQPVSKTMSVSSLYALAKVDFKLAAARFRRLWSTFWCSAAMSSELKLVTLGRVTSIGRGRCRSSGCGLLTLFSTNLSL
ncbi:hypothetical protein OGATHE_005733 [Ogataea polymorpha]|uniref:Uncharacterized protein n=1 Tax=Ogataea polymorpha TaxID=460523 RepID=A0A9P8SYG1_9ASCO|nr:hypothetical protein OGATHE_005733 [Ogataea polymorpha]